MLILILLCVLTLTPRTSDISLKQVYIFISISSHLEEPIDLFCISNELWMWSRLLQLWRCEWLFVDSFLQLHSMFPEYAFMIELTDDDWEFRIRIDSEEKQRFSEGISLYILEIGFLIRFLLINMMLLDMNDIPFWTMVACVRPWYCDNLHFRSASLPCQIARSSCISCSASDLTSFSHCVHDITSVPSSTNASWIIRKKAMEIKYQSERHYPKNITSQKLQYAGMFCYLRSEFKNYL